MKRATIFGLIVVVVILTVFFVGGGWLAYDKTVNTDQFLLVATVVAGVVGVVSLFGLLSVGRKPMTADDLGNVEAGLVEKVATSLKTFNELQDKVATSRQEVDELATKRAEIELLMRQATLKIFLEEKLKTIAIEVEDRVNGDNRLLELMKSYEEVREQVTMVDGELNKTGRAAEVLSILNEVRDMDLKGSLPADSRRRDPVVGGVIIAADLMAEITKEMIRAFPIIGPATRRLERRWRR